MLFFTLNREDFSFVIHLDRQPRTSRRREAQTGSRARSGSRSERTLDAVEHSRTLMEWWPFLIFHRGGLRIKVINNTKYMVRHRIPPSHTWRSFLDNHVKDLVSLDFFTLPTATFRVLFVFIVLRHDRRRIVHFNVTEHPSAEWTAQQMVDAFPWDTAPRYLVRDRDQTYGAYFDTRVDGLGIEQVLTAPRSPWQNPFVERMIGSIRRECLDHVIVLDERHLKRILRKYVDYYHSCRTHLSLEKDAPEPRRVELPAMGKVSAIPKVGGLHHHYTRRAA